jgi:hypothetical protein
MKNDHIKNDRIKSDRIKSDRIKSDRIKTDRIKTDRIKSITDPSGAPAVIRTLLEQSHFTFADLFRAGFPREHFFRGFLGAPAVKK